MWEPPPTNATERICRPWDGSEVLAAPNKSMPTASRRHHDRKAGSCGVSKPKCDALPFDRVTGNSKLFPFTTSSVMSGLLRTCLHPTTIKQPDCYKYLPYSLLDANGRQRFKCIAVQGGRDGICPPDTALDLCQAYPGDFELRMPVHAGHSMYDPFLTNELVKATDQIVDDLNANCPSL